jgi:hypothetical protein
MLASVASKRSERLPRSAEKPSLAVGAFAMAYLDRAEGHMGQGLSTSRPLAAFAPSVHSFREVLHTRP